MYYQPYNFGGGYGCMPQTCCQGTNKRGGYGYALILVLFILLVIIGAARW